MPFSWLDLGTVQKVCNSEDIREQNAICRCAVPFQTTFLVRMPEAKANTSLPTDNITYSSTILVHAFKNSFSESHRLLNYYVTLIGS